MIFFALSGFLVGGKALDKRRVQLEAEAHFGGKASNRFAGSFSNPSRSP